MEEKKRLEEEERLRAEEERKRIEEEERKAEEEERRREEEKQRKKEKEKVRGFLTSIHSIADVFPGQTRASQEGRPPFDRQAEEGTSCCRTKKTGSSRFRRPDRRPSAAIHGICGEEGRLRQEKERTFHTCYRRSSFRGILDALRATVYACRATRRRTTHSGSEG